MLRFEAGVWGQQVQAQQSAMNQNQMMQLLQLSMLQAQHSGQPMAGMSPAFRLASIS